MSLFSCYVFGTMITGGELLTTNPLGEGFVKIYSTRLRYVTLYISKSDIGYVTMAKSTFEVMSSPAAAWHLETYACWTRPQSDKLDERGKQDQNSLCRPVRVGKAPYKLVQEALRNLCCTEARNMTKYSHRKVQ